MKTKMGIKFSALFFRVSTTVYNVQKYGVEFAAVQSQWDAPWIRFLLDREAWDVYTAMDAIIPTVLNFEVVPDFFKQQQGGLKH